jgi:hypothetical protein
MAKVVVTRYQIFLSHQPGCKGFDWTGGHGEVSKAINGVVGANKQVPAVN